MHRTALTGALQDPLPAKALSFGARTCGPALRSWRWRSCWPRFDQAVAADAARGQELYESRCGGCHSLDANRVGPAHRGVYGRKAGSAPNFSYRRQSRIPPWCGEATLDAWLRQSASSDPPAHELPRRHGRRSRRHHCPSAQGKVGEALWTADVLPSQLSRRDARAQESSEDHRAEQRRSQNIDTDNSGSAPASACRAAARPSSAGWDSTPQREQETERPEQQGERCAMLT